MRKTVRVAIIGIASLAAASLYGWHVSARAEERRVASQARQETAFRTGGFMSATATGDFTKVVEPDRHRGDYLVPDLVKASEVIVTGRVVGGQGLLVPSGDRIRTHYTVHVDEVIKGRNRVGLDRNIVVSILGGRVTLTNGRVAQLLVRYSRLPIVGERYLLFLNPVAATAVSRADSVDFPSADYWPLLGSVGVISFGAQGSDLTMTDRRKGSGVAGIREKAAHVFLADLRQSAISQR